MNQVNYLRKWKTTEFLIILESWSIIREKEKSGVFFFRFFIHLFFHTHLFRQDIFADHVRDSMEVSVLYWLNLEGIFKEDFIRKGVKDAQKS